MLSVILEIIKTCVVCEGHWNDIGKARERKMGKENLFQELECNLSTGISPDFDSELVTSLLWQIMYSPYQQFD